MIVKPKYFIGHSISWNLNVLNGPKFTITCENCSCDFEVRIPKKDYPVVPCPNCKAGNKMELVWN